MTDQRIITFLTLLETMNYHDTAERLNMTQPAVTQHIKSLEREYGKSFFIYDRHKLSKTADCDILESFARSMVRNENNIKIAFEKPKIRTLRIGATKTVGEYIIGGMVKNYLSYPLKSIELNVENTERLLHMLDFDKLDFAIIEGAFDKSKYSYSLFRKEKFTGICSQNSKLCGKSVNLDELLCRTLFLREHGSGTRDIFESHLIMNGYSPSMFERVSVISNFSLLCRLVAEDCGISFVYESVAKSEKGIGTFELSGLPDSHELNFVYLKNTNSHLLVEDFLK